MTANQEAQSAESADMLASTDTHATYRAQIRETLQSLSDRALAFQDARIVGGIDREECDRELARRATPTK